MEKEIFEWVVAAYGFVIPWNQEVTAEEFANKITETFCLSEPRNKVAHDTALNSNCVFIHNHKGTGYKQLTA